MGWGGLIHSFGRHFITLLIATIAGSFLQALISGLIGIYIPFSTINSLLDYMSLSLGITPESLLIMDDATLANAGYVSLVFIGTIFVMSALLAWSDNKSKPKM